jgi:hypothetical protein
MEQHRKNIASTATNEYAAYSQSREPAMHESPPSSDWRPQPRRTRQWYLPVICALALLGAGGMFLLTAGPTLTSSQRQLPAHTFSLNGHGTLVVHESSGSLHIHPGSGDQIIVHGSVHTNSFIGKTYSPHVQYMQQGNSVTVTADENWVLAGSSDVSLDIAVPASCDIRLQTSSANAVIETIAGSITADTSSGNLDLHSTSGALTLNTSSGDISLTDEQGPLSAHSTSGNISAIGLHGPVDLSTTSGNITLEQAQISGPDHLRSSSGDISFRGTLDPQGSYRMETSSGNIVLQLPTTSAFQLSASSSSGELHNEFAAVLVGNSPRASIQLHTSSGNISVRTQ